MVAVPVEQVGRGLPRRRRAQVPLAAALALLQLHALNNHSDCSNVSQYKNNTTKLFKHSAPRHLNINISFNVLLLQTQSKHDRQ